MLTQIDADGALFFEQKHAKIAKKIHISFILAFFAIFCSNQSEIEEGLN